MRKYLISIIAVLASAACTEEKIPVSDLSVEGCWVVEAGNESTDTYYEFRMGKRYCYMSIAPHHFSNGTIWGCSASDFSLYSAEDYYLKSGHLFIGGSDRGAVSFPGDGSMVVSGDHYFPVVRFTSDKYVEADVTSLRICCNGRPVSGQHVRAEKGDILNFSADVFPSDTPEIELSWFSGSSAVLYPIGPACFEACSNGTAKISVCSSSDPSVKDSCFVDISTRLGKGGTANCFIAPDEGRYIIDLSDFPEAESAALVWRMSVSSNESTPVGNVCFDKLSSELSFEVDFDDTTAGNALVAALDAEGNVVWSWHIWAARAYDPSFTSIEFGPASSRLQLMDRNLGALDGPEGDGLLSSGLMYQWGRKEPFPGATSQAGTYYVVTVNDPRWPWSDLSYDDIVVSPQFAVAHPTSFLIGSNTSGEWLSEEYFIDYSRWSGDVKSKYDPCPEGWRLPGGSIWSGAASCWSETLLGSLAGIGVCYDSADKPVLFPASGILSGGVGKPLGVGQSSYLYSGSCIFSRLSTVGYGFFLADKTLFETIEMPASAACPVRCVSDTR